MLAAGTRAKASAVLAVKLLLARLSIPAGPAWRPVAIAAAVTTPIPVAAPIAAAKRLAAALAIAAAEGTATAFAITAKRFPASRRAACVFAVLPFVQEDRIEAITPDHALIAPDGLDGTVFGDSLDSHAHRAGFQHHQVADFKFFHCSFLSGRLSAPIMSGWLCRKDHVLPAAMKCPLQRLVPSASATVKMSLSPRPHMFITIRVSRDNVGASFATWASAWLGSRAGMMPSVRQENWKASSASLSVALTYSTRPISCSQACSGPTPG